MTLYYLRAAWHETRSRGLRRGIRRFWVGRWFWSCGHIGPVPNGYARSYWK